MNRELNAYIRDKLQTPKTVLDLLSQGKDVPKELMEHASKDVDESIDILDGMEFVERNAPTRPPGFYSALAEGYKTDKRVKVDVFDEHRFLFYSLATFSKEFKRELKERYKPITLITIDYHQDLHRPNKVEKLYLNTLNLEDEQKVAFYSWHDLRGDNATQILSAAYLDLIGDIYVMCNAEKWGKDTESFKDKHGKPHKINFFNDWNQFLCSIAGIDNYLALDIDLDYFNEYGKDGANSSEIKDEMFDFLSPQSDFMRCLYGKIRLITIAKEPSFSGGIGMSHKLFGKVNDRLFSGYLGKKAKLKIYDK